MKRDLLSIADLSAEDIWRLIRRAVTLKSRRVSQELYGRNMALLFQKPSLRTNVSFQVAMNQLGGHAIYLSPSQVGLGSREPAADVARVLSRYVDVVVARTYSQALVEELAENADIPVVNGLSDQEHPCQALADLLTIHEKRGELGGTIVAYVGDANNVANSLLLAAATVGMEFRLATPPGYQPQKDILQEAEARAKARGSPIIVTHEPAVAVSGAHVVYTDVWTSMGREAEQERRRQDFAAFQITPRLFAQAPGALLMHPMPIHWGEELAEELRETAQSVILDQAENRLHIQKAVLLDLLGL